MNRRSICYTLAALAIAGLAGCAAWSTTNAASATPPPSAVSLHYELDPNAAAPLLAFVESNLPDGVTATPSSAPRSIELQISPADSHRVRAIVTLVESGRTHAAYELILSAAELDLVVARLRNDRFFEGASRPGGHARIDIGFGNSIIARKWTPEPRLDDVVERTIRFGRRIPLDHSSESVPRLP